MADRDLFGQPAIARSPPDAVKGMKRPRGSYYTPDPLALAICRTLRAECGIVAPRSILEPGCGGGAFLRGASAAWPSCKNLVGVDLVPCCEGPGVVVKGNLFQVPAHDSGGWDLIVGNPDYGIAELAVRHCLSILSPHGHLAFLLRAAFLGSTGRVPLYTYFPLRYLAPIAQRPSFTEDGKTDPMEYGLFIWAANHTGRGEILPPLVWR